MNPKVGKEAATRYRRHFGSAATVMAYAPGRVEILGNHTDYNEGYVLSAAINRGTFFLAGPTAGRVCRVVAGDLLAAGDPRAESRFELDSLAPVPQPGWSGYVKGVVAKLLAHGAWPHGFQGLFLGDLPLGAGLSSSAALEISCALALCALYGWTLPPLELARIGQAAEHEFVGIRCGLLDQITSLFGREDALVFTDFRTLAVETVPLGREAVLLLCNTGVKHALVESEYNVRRAACERAAAFFAGVLPHPVRALRDVSWEEWRGRPAGLDATDAQRAAHIIGENERVLRGRELLRAGQLEAFGALMFDSHESSRTLFENSCPELDDLVAAARGHTGVLGARLSGGGFGGSVLVLVRREEAERVARELQADYARAYGEPCTAMVVRPSAGASSGPCAER